MSMRAYAFVILMLTTGVLSCNNPGSNHYTGGDALPSTMLDIDPTHDTTVTTPGGAILKIPQGALDAGGAASVKLEVKEAYSLEDMIRGKLFTRSEDLLLSSGGMIYINGAAGQNVTINQPITVKIPTADNVRGMMVYDGQVDPVGMVHWLDPRPLADDADSRKVSMGKDLFQTHCASCHALKGTVTGPPLAFITGRRDRKWLAEYTRNNARLLWRGDGYSCFLFNRFNKTPMTVFPNLTDNDLDALYAYISQASKGIDSNAVPDLKRTFDSCAQNDPYCSGVSAKTNFVAGGGGGAKDPAGGGEGTKDLAAGGGVGAKDSAAGGGDPVAVGATGGGTSSYYSFTIHKLGWTNVDNLLRELPGVLESELTVRVDSVNPDKAEVFLGIPSMRVLEKGTFSTDKNAYTFYTADGQILLPQRVAAYIVVRSENEGQTLFGKTKWITGRKQELSVSVKPMSKEDIDHAIHELPFDSTDMQMATVFDTTGSSPSGNGGAATADAGTTSGSGTADPGAATSSGTAEAGTKTAGAGAPGNMAVKGKGRRRRGARSVNLSCPCWCDEMNYRMADSIARAANHP
jgi:mono/diheme cytochrome c family protein